MPFGDRNHHSLYRRQPYRERARVMLDQYPEEALDRSKQRAVNHQWLLARTIFGHVLQFEALRQVEIELHGGKLPQASDRINQLDIDFRAVKCGFAWNYLVLD